MAELKKKIELEYLINTSPVILFIRLSTPSGLAEWFADKVTAEGKVFTFAWSGVEEKAEQVLKKDNKVARYQWIEDEDNTWFEFLINVDELTEDVALLVTDHVDPDDINDSVDLWDKQIDVLKRCLGSL